MTRTELLRKYVQYGWTIVPLKEGTKMPAVNWKEYQTRKPTTEELRAWFSNPETGVGLITGKASGVVVIDEDSYKKENPSAIPLDSPLRVKTGGGGRHLYFKYVEGLNNTVNKDLAVDIRAEGGFVVLPPSKHPSGNYYAWETELPDNLDSLPTLQEESFLNEIYKRRNSDQEFEPLKAEDYMNIGQGSRNDSLHRIACSLFNKHQAKEAFELLLAVNKTYDPPLSEHEVKVIAESAYKFVNNHPSDEFKEKMKAKTSTTEKPLEILKFDDAQKEYQELMKKYQNGITTGYNVLDSYFRFLPRQLYMISASTHVGKTTLALNIAGRAARAGHRVILASLEQGVFVIPRLIQMFGDDVGLRNIDFVAPDFMPTPDNFIELLQKDSDKPSLLIVDHLHYFRRGSKNASEEIDRLIVDLQMLANKLEIPVILVAHVRKLNYMKPKPDKDGIVHEPAPTMDDMKDSSSLSQVPGVVMMMQRQRNPEEDIRNGAPVYSNEGTLYIYKNRIYGVTGNENFKIYDTGEIVFAKEPNDRINGGGLPAPSFRSGEVVESDIMDDLGL